MPYGKKRYSKNSLSSRVASRSSRSRRARAAVVAAARRSGGRSMASRGPKHSTGARGTQQVGLAKFLTHYKPLPKYSKIELALERHGHITLNEWRRFQSYERTHLCPDSGKTQWLGVPDRLVQGTQVTVPTADSDYVPGNCDLYDIGRRLVARYSDQGVTTTNVYSEITDDAYQPAGDASSSTGETTQAPGFLSRIRGIQVRNQWCEVLMENTSSIDAFVEQYALEYRRPLAVGEWGAHFEGKIQTALAAPRSMLTHSTYGGGYVGGWDRTGDAPTAWNYTPDYNNDPRMFLVNKQYPYSSHLNPYKDCAAGSLDARNYGTRLAACMLEQYARICINHRLKQAPVVPYRKWSGVAASDVSTLVTAMTPEQLLCNPMNDPNQAFPRSVKNTHGYRLVKIRKAVVLKPGQSMKVKIPMKESFYQDFADLPRVADRDADVAMSKRLVQSFDADQLDYNTYSRQASSLPNRIRCHFFRVFGDMISDKTQEDTAGDTDFQTGSCRVQFMIRRSVDCRVAQDKRVKLVDPLFEFDTKVSNANQQAINDETDAPAVVVSA